ncbi:hypothetical protein WDZ17_05085 [Pseudokineococcus basanitobsidens]|uniref:Fimbrial assembly protein PilN n=1 Tax=Pseudokineococcus basanitobsidens TaxID=1926649 RepID=A0ABU8RHW6_9ACTN
MSFSSTFGSTPGTAGGAGLPGQRRADGADVEVVVLGGVPRVDLLPASVAAGDRFRRLQLGLAAGLALVLVGAAGATLLAGAGVADAQQDLATEQARTSALQAEQAQYAEVPLLRGQQAALEQARDTAMADDVLWYRYSARLSNALPADLRLTTLDMQLGDDGAVDPTAAVAGAPAAALGSMTLSLEGSAVPDTADLLDVLGDVPGLDGPWADSTTAEGEGDGTVVQAHADVSDEALSHRYPGADAATTDGGTTDGGTTVGGTTDGDVADETTTEGTGS